MNFDSDAFISYAHVDDLPLAEGQKGWVTNFHHALEVRVTQLLGKEPRIWRDPELRGNDRFAEKLFDRLHKVAVLVTVITPRYVASEWAMKELSEFHKASEIQGGVHIDDKLRIFKVMKTPVPRDKHPRELQPVLGYEFFKIDPETGRVRELDGIFGAEAERDFWLKLDDMAHDICQMLEQLEHPDALLKQGAKEKVVFLAETTSDLREQRESLKRDLQQHGYTVLPNRAMSSVASEVTAAVTEDLDRCQMSVMLVGRNYSLVPEGGTQSLLEIQNQLTIERAKSRKLDRLLWIPPDLKVEDERQLRLIDRLRVDPEMMRGADLLETLFEELRTVILDKLKQPLLPEPKVAQQISALATHESTLPRLYVIYDQRDTESVAAWVDHLYNDCEVTQPAFDGDEAEIREYHSENLCDCDGVVIFCGSTNEMWVRRKIREVQKAPGYGRTKPAPRIAIVLGPPRTVEKERFRTHDAMVLQQFDGVAPEVLAPFVASLKG